MRQTDDQLIRTRFSNREQLKQISLNDMCQSSAFKERVPKGQMSEGKKRGREEKRILNNFK